MSAPSSLVGLRRLALLLLVPAFLLIGACNSAGQGQATGGGAKPQPEKPSLPTTRAGTADRQVDVGSLTAEDQAEMQRAWRLFLDADPRWARARADWIAKGPAARTILAENLFRYFWSASGVMKKDEILRVGREAAFVGEEATVYFADLLALDKWPLREATTTNVFDPDNASRPGTVTVTHISIDDVTRQNAALVLSLIGATAVPTLSKPEILAAPRPSSRTYALYALGTIGNDAAVSTLGAFLASGAEWKDRGAAAKALGFALQKNPGARAPLERALQDPDAFVRKKAQEALDGKSRWEV